MMRKTDENRKFTHQDEQKLNQLMQKSAVDDDEIRHDMKEIVKEKQD